MIVSDRRPWGWYKGISFDRWWVKLIRVHPMQRTSIQYHKHRTELQIDLLWPRVRLVRPFKVHWMFDGWYLELAWGHPREDDIVRQEDRYGRTKSVA